MRHARRATRPPRWPSASASQPPSSAVWSSASARPARWPHSPAGAAPPFKGWQAGTFVGALTAGGLVAPRALEGAMNGEWFVAYVEQVLVPALRPGMVVVMDNLPCHKVRGVEEAIRAAGCRLEYL